MVRYFCALPPKIVYKAPIHINIYPSSHTIIQQDLISHLKYLDLCIYLMCTNCVHVIQMIITNDKTIHNNIFIKITEYSLQSLLIMMYHVFEKHNLLLLFNHNNETGCIDLVKYIQIVVQ